EIKALLQHPAVGGEIATDALPAFFLFGYAPTPITLYRGILAVPPGHVLEMDATGRLTVEPYWSLPVETPAAGPTGRPGPTLEDAAARVRELATDAVRRRLVADVPLGAFLSGGLDSTIVVGLMSRLRPESVRTFSIGFASAPRFDERAYARLAAARFGTAHTEFVVEPSSPDLIERLVWHHDGPFTDASAIPPYLRPGLTRRSVTVALNGDGGDELFGGYLRFYAAMLADRLPAWLSRGAGRAFGAWPERGGHRSWWRLWSKFLAGAGLPREQRL